MSTPVRARDREHFSIVRDSLARDGLHVAMVAHDRRQLQDYAGTLARALAADAGLRVEAYSASRIESVVVDLMLHRFDAALSDISLSGPSGRHRTGPYAFASRPGCILFVPDAHALSRAEFRQLLRIAAGTQRNGLRLVALFDASSPHCDERIAEMGTQVARWDLDDESDFDRRHPVSRASQSSMFATSSMRSLPRIRHRAARNGSRWLAAAAVAAMLAATPLLPRLAGDDDLLARDKGGTVTRSGIVELAGEPRQDYLHAQTIDDRSPALTDARVAARADAHDGVGAIAASASGDDAVRASRMPPATDPEALQR